MVNVVRKKAHKRLTIDTLHLQNVMFVVNNEKKAKLWTAKGEQGRKRNCFCCLFLLGSF